MKALVLGIVLICIAGCDTRPMYQQVDATTTRCLDGVVYYMSSVGSGYQGYGYMAPKFNADGSIALCSQVKSECE